jgi:signal transduction histidine kinase
VFLLISKILIIFNDTHKNFSKKARFQHEPSFFYEANMKKTNGSLTQLKFIYVLTTIFLVALSIYTFIQIKSLIDSSEQVNQVNQITQTLQKISTSIFEAETNKRGFLLSGDSSMLRKRDVALNSIVVDVTLLDSLIKDNPVQIQNLKRLKKVIQEKITALKNLVVEENNMQMDSLIKVNTLQGVQKMDMVNREIDDMIKVETNLFKIHTKRYNRDLFIAPFFIIILFMGAMLILLFSYFKIYTALNHAWRLQKELTLQNEEKENRATELMIANKELAFQNEEKEKRATELMIANDELAFQNEEKEKRATELMAINNELQLFAHISSHDLQEPLRKLQMAASRIAEKDIHNLSDKGKEYFKRMQDAALSMETLINDLIDYARANNKELNFENADLHHVIQEAIAELKERIDAKQAVIEVVGNCKVHIIPFQLRQMMHNLIGNSLKFSKPHIPPHIIIKSLIIKGSELNNENLLPQESYCHISISDNGIGFEPEYQEKVFEAFQRLHGKDKYKGTGIGLAIAKKIVENHHGIITATSKLGEGATFDIYIPTQIPTQINKLQ